MTALDKTIASVTPPEDQDKRAQAHAKARAVAEPGDWLSQILDHHEQIQAAFAALRATDDAASRRAAQKDLGILLNGHAMAEEAVVYPALAHIGKMLSADMAYIEQVAAKMQIAALDHLDPLSEDYLDKLGHLEGAVLHHVYSEEKDWFVALKAQASAEDQAMVTERYAEEYGRYMRGGETPRGTARATALAEPRSFSTGATT
jgi:hypothetical protein